MLEQDVDDCLAGDIVVGAQAQRGKIFIFADKGRGFLRQEVEKAYQIRTAYGLFQVLDDVELDVPLAQDIQRAAGFASARVVIDGELFHERLP